MTFIFVNQISLGEILEICIGVFLVGSVIAGFIGYQWLKTHPFTVEVSLDPYDYKPSGKIRRPRACVKQMDLGLGDNAVLIRVSPRKGTSWDKVNIRFVNRKLSLRLNRIWRYEDSNQDIIQVTDFRDIIYDTKGEIGGRYFESDPDGVGGYDGLYDPILPVKENELVWFYVYIRANDKWKGFASFEGALDNRRSWARIKAKVNLK